VLLRPEALLPAVLPSESNTKEGNKNQLDVFEPSHSKIVDQYGGNQRTDEQLCFD